MAKKKPKKIDITARIRGYILDSQITSPHEISIVLGCSIISDEVKEHEEKESDKRVDRISYLIPVLHAHAHIISEGAVEFQRHHETVKDQDISDDIWDKSQDMMEHISMSALLGSISQLVDMGLLKVPKEHK